MYLHIPMSKGGERRDRKEKKERLELQQLHSKVNISIQKIGGGGGGGGGLCPHLPISGGRV